MPMTPAQEWVEVERHKAGDRAASTRLLRANEGLLQLLARRFSRKSGVDLDDCLQQARIGLLEGFTRTDREKSAGGRANTYAMVFARNAVRAFCEGNDFAVSLPVYARRSDMLEKNQHVPRAAVSMQERVERVSVGDSMTVADTIEAEDDTEDRREKALAVSDVVDGLGAVTDPREREILVREFGLDGKECETCADIARRWGLSRERVRQLRERAISRFKSRLAGEPDPIEKVGRKKRKARARKKRAADTADTAKEEERVRKLRIQNFAGALGHLFGLPWYRVVAAVERETTARRRAVTELEG